MFIRVVRTKLRAGSRPPTVFEAQRISDNHAVVNRHSQIQAYSTKKLHVNGCNTEFTVHMTIYGVYTIAFYGSVLNRIMAATVKRYFNSHQS